MKTDLRNELIWSPGRYNALRRCEKQYFWKYIGSWGGWDMSAPPEAQKAYRLKHLTTPVREMERLIKERICQTFADAITGEDIGSTKEAIRESLRDFHMYVQRSRKMPLLEVTRKNSKFKCDETGQPLSQETISGLLRHMYMLLTGFYDLAPIQKILSSPSILLKKVFQREDFRIGHELGVPARMQAEAVWNRENTIIVGTWNTGFASQFDWRNAALLDLYVRGILQLPEDIDMEVHTFYLAAGHTQVFRFHDEDREALREEILEEFQILKSHSDNPFINTAVAEKFTARVGQHCDRCPFQELCPEFENYKKTKKERWSYVR